MIVFDLDDTLRTTAGSEHLVPADTTRTENWVNWQNWVNANGKPTKWCGLYAQSHTDAMIVTSSAFGTRDWLRRNGLPLPGFGIVERESMDHRHPFMFKKAFLDGPHAEIELWVDDNPDVCDLVLNYGIAVLQVPGLHKSKAAPLHSLHTTSPAITIGLRGSSVLVEVKGRRFHWPHEFVEVDGNSPVPPTNTEVLYECQDGRISIGCNCDWRKRGKTYDVIRYLPL